MKLFQTDSSKKTGKYHIEDRFEVDGRVVSLKKAKCNIYLRDRDSLVFVEAKPEHERDICPSCLMQAYKDNEIQVTFKE